MKRTLLELMASGAMPFMLATDTGIKLNYGRIIEAILIAGVAGMMAAYMTVSELKLKLAYMEGSMTKVCSTIETMRSDVVRIDTLQKERLERERIKGIR